MKIPAPIAVAFRRVLLTLLLAAASASLPVGARAATITVGTFAQFEDGCTIGNAVRTAQTQASVGGCPVVGAFGDDIIVLPSGTYALDAPDNGNNGFPVITGDITIAGQGSTITRSSGASAPFFRFFLVTGGHLKLLELELSGGLVRQDNGGGAIRVVGNAALTFAGVSLTGNEVRNPASVARGGAVYFQSRGALTVRSTLVANNSANASGDIETGAGTAAGGGIHVDGTDFPEPIAATFVDVAFLANEAISSAIITGGGGGTARGGAVSFEGRGAMTVTRGTFQGNSTQANAAAGYGGTSEGGAISFDASDERASLDLASVRVAVNTSIATGFGEPVSDGGVVRGAGVYFTSPGSALSVRDSTFRENFGNATGWRNGGVGRGGGLAIEAGPGTITIVRSAFVENGLSADGGPTPAGNGGTGRGGGIDYNGSGDLTLSAVTLAGNAVTANPGAAAGAAGGTGEGGGASFDSPGTLTLINVTVANNSAAAAGAEARGGGIALDSGATIQNSIFGGNSAVDDPNCHGSPITSLGNNLFADGAACGSNATDKVGVPAGLGPFTDTGQPGGASLPLTAGSQAIDGAHAAACPTIDQLGRGHAGPCDIGAVEFVTAVPLTSLLAAVLPASRAGLAGATLTAFVTVINVGLLPAYQVRLGLGTPAVPGVLSYQTTDPSTNLPTGIPNTPVDISPNGIQTYVIALLVTGAFDPTDLALTYVGTNTSAVAPIVGLNTFLASGSVTAIPDVVALAATAPDPGIVNLSGPTLGGAFAVATINLGAGGPITVTTGTGGAVLPVSIFVCPTDALGECITPPEPSPTVPITANATPTFAVFIQASAAIAFDPAFNRIFLFFKDAGGAIRGGTSVAVRTIP